MLAQRMKRLRWTCASAALLSQEVLKGVVPDAMSWLTDVGGPVQGGPKSSMANGGNMSEARIYVGIDLGNEKHALCAVDPAGNVIGRKLVRNDVDALERLKELIGDVNPGEVYVAVEDRRHALVDALCGLQFVVHAINPKQVDRFRDRFAMSGAKDDERDSFVIACSLRTDTALFRRLAVEPVHIVELRSIEDRLAELDEEHRRLSNRLRALLLRYFPTMLSLCGGADEPWFWDLLLLLKAPGHARGIEAAQIAAVLKAHRIRRVTCAGIEALIAGGHLEAAPGIADACLHHAGLLIERLRLSSRQRARETEAQRTLLASQRGEPGAPTDAELLLSVPGIGPKTATALLVHGGALLAAPDGLRIVRSLAGVAPVTKRSGKSHVVTMRKACNERLRNALHQGANRARQLDARLAEIYARQRAQKASHARALRTVGDRLLLIVHALLRTRTPFDPARRVTAALTP